VNMRIRCTRRVQESERSCICVLGVLGVSRKVSGRVYVC
jgi:hypothetical protein